MTASTPTDRIYLSGPMSGLPDYNFPFFHAAAARLRDAGLDVVNPAEINPDSTLTWHQCLRADIAALTTCTTLALMPGWQQSQGAHLELHVAHRLGLRIATVDELCGDLEPLCHQGVLLGLLADIRRAAGDPNGRLMQDELVTRIADHFPDAGKMVKEPK